MFRIDSGFVQSQASQNRYGLVLVLLQTFSKRTYFAIIPGRGKGRTKWTPDLGPVDSLETCCACFMRSADFDMKAEIADSVGKLGCDAGAAREVCGAEVLIAGAVV